MRVYVTIEIVFDLSCNIADAARAAMTDFGSTLSLSEYVLLVANTVNAESIER